MGIVVGLALSVALFRGLENHEVISRIDQANGPAPVTAQERREIRDQLSGSADARAEIQENLPQVRNQVNSIADDAFSKGLQAVMLLGAGLSFAAVWSSLWGRRRRETTTHRQAHGFSPAHWRHHVDATPGPG
jgi:hypothetical protein